MPNCDPDSGTAAKPDPCVSKRERLSGGSVQFTVLTSNASAWNFGKVLKNTSPGKDKPKDKGHNSNKKPKPKKHKAKKHNSKGNGGKGGGAPRQGL